MVPRSAPYDVLVVGLGLSGLVAGLAALRLGARVLVLGKGYGTTHFRSGAIDVLGYLGGHPVASPLEAVSELAAAAPDHPYALAGDDLEPALELAREAAGEGGVRLEGVLSANHLLSTAAGTLRPGCLAPASFLARWDGARVVAVGVAGYRDFSPELFAASFPTAAAGRGIRVSVRAAHLELPEPRRHLDSLALARLFDQPAFRVEMARRLREEVRAADLVALPAVVGLEDPNALDDLAERLGVACVELSTVPPSVPGIRLQRALEAALRRREGRVLLGPWVRAVRQGGRVGWLEVEGPARPLRIPAGEVVLATGGLASGGLRLERSGEVTETVAGLPVASPPGRPEEWFREPFLGRQAQPASTLGVRVDRGLRPTDEAGRVVCGNLFAAGGLLAGAMRTAERSADGIACATAYRAARVAREAAA